MAYNNLLTTSSVRLNEPSKSEDVRAIERRTRDEPSAAKFLMANVSSSTSITIKQSGTYAFNARSSLSSSEDDEADVTNRKASVVGLEAGAAEDFVTALNRLMLIAPALPSTSTGDPPAYQPPSNAADDVLAPRQRSLIAPARIADRSQTSQSIARSRDLREGSSTSADRAADRASKSATTTRHMEGARSPKSPCNIDQRK